MKQANRVSGGVRSHQVRYSIVLTALFAAAWMAPATLWAQSGWPGYPNNNTISVTSGGNVGIGTTSPTHPLEITGSGSIVPLFKVGDNAGNYTRYVGGGYNDFNSYGASLRFYTAANSIVFRTAAADPAMIVVQSGNVGIGTANPQYLLSVNGTIGAKEFLVTNTGWSDYIFQPGYKLRPLSEVSAFIRANHHLPDIPSEAEVKEKGVGVGEMQAKLLAKVEELTLHLIEQEKENNELRERLAQLESRVAGDSGVTSGR